MQALCDPSFDSTFPLAEGRAAFEQALSGHNRGKIVISLLAEVDDITLIETSKQLVSYTGLATSTKQSSETTRHGGITMRGRKRLRTICIQAVMAMMNRTNTPLMEFYQKKKREKGAGKAICATARKRLTIIFVVLKKELDY